MGRRHARVKGPSDAPDTETTLGPAPCEPIDRYKVFIFEGGEAHVAPKPKNPETFRPRALSAMLRRRTKRVTTTTARE